MRNVAKWLFLIYAKLLENSKLALVCCSDEWRGWVSSNSQIVKVAHQPLLSSIRVNWGFSSNCGYMVAWKLRYNNFSIVESPNDNDWMMIFWQLTVFFIFFDVPEFRLCISSNWVISQNFLFYSHKEFYDLKHLKFMCLLTWLSLKSVGIWIC